MHHWKRSLPFGFLTWLIPFSVSLLFYSRDGTLLIDIFLFKSIMIVLGGFVGLSFIIGYFRVVDRAFLREGVLIGSIWLAINWLLDFIFFVIISKMDLGAYFVQIGMRYLTIPMYSIAIGLILRRQVIRLEAASSQKE